MSWFIALILAGSIFTSGNNLSNYEYQKEALSDVNSVRNAQTDETESFEKTYPFNPNGKIEVSNVNGSIYMEGWDRPEIQLSATKVASTKERLTDVEIQIENMTDSFSVSTKYKSWKHSSDGSKRKYRSHGKLHVTLRLKVPRTAFLDGIETVNGSVEVSNMTNYTKISAVNGSVKASNLRGTAKLSTVNGTVYADFDDLSDSSVISLNTVNGTVKLSIPSSANATVKANTLNGSIINEFGLPIRKGKYVGRDMYGKIGSGDVKIRLSSVNGSLSINNKDGGITNPSVNLLKQKTSDDFDDSFETQVTVNTQRINADVAKAMKESRKASKVAEKEARKQHRKAQRDAQRQIERETRRQTRAEARVNSERLKEAIDEEEIEKEETEKEIRAAMKEAQRELSPASETFYLSRRSPYIQEKGGSFEVKGIPNVVIDAEDCDVIVRGWDKKEVSYTISRITRTGINRNTLRTRVSSDESDVEIEIEREDSGTVRFNKDSVRLEVFVPKKSNLKVSSKQEIRLEGVKGELELNGNNNSINVRDSYGRLRVETVDGIIRVIGFEGYVETNSVDGDIYLEGDFKKIRSKSNDGKVYLTLSEAANATIVADNFGFKGRYKIGSTMTIGELHLIKENYNSWRIGEGSSKYNFGFADGYLVVRSQESLGSN